MNGSDLLCEGVRALLRSAAGCVPAVGLGVVRRDGSAHLEVEYVDAYGATAYRAGGDAVAAAFRPGQTGHRRVEASELEAHAAGLVESRLLLTGLPDHVRTQPRVQCVVTLPTGAAEPSVLFVALAAADALTASQIDALESRVACCPDYSRPRDAAYDEVCPRRRLPAVERLLPAFLHVHDAAGIYDRLSEIQNDVLRFDFAALGILSDDLERVDVYARTVSDAPFPESGPMPFPRVQTDAWLYRIVDDLTAHPAERDHPVVDAGGRTSIRVAVRLDDRTLAALNFTSRDAAPYTAVDLAVTRRIAEYAALALSHQRLAEQAPRAMRTRGEKRDLIDEELAAVLDGGDLQSAFDRVSTVVQKVLPHDALLLKRADEAIGRAARLEARLRAVVEELDARAGCRTVVGDSNLWRHVLTQTTHAPNSETTVLLVGEGGTGKEVVARVVHRASLRANGPFVAVNCAALPEQLLEAELFGCERGGHGAAAHITSGHLEQAVGGTLFLDEVGELSPSSQAKLLQLVDEHEFQRLGGTQIFRTDARIIAATNRDLERAVADGDFRADLFERLDAFAIHLPPLRERRDDILPLSDALLVEIGRGIGRPPAGLSHAARSLLVDYRWPGNVRELRNILERAAILCGGEITVEHLAFNVATKLT